MNTHFLDSFGVPIAGNLSLVGAEDEYTFNGTAGDEIYLTFVSGEFIPRFELIRPDGTTQVEQEWGKTLQVSLDQTGLYKLLVSDANETSTGEYGLTLQRTNNPQNTKAIAFGIPLLETTSTLGEADTFTFDGTAGDQVYLSVDSKTLPFTDIRIFRPDGSLLASNRTDLIDVEDLQTVLDATGTYTVVLWANFTLIPTNTYSLAIQRTNNPENASEINFNAPISGKIDGLGEKDTFTFKANAGEEVFLIVNGRGLLLPEIKVFRPDGSRLTTEKSSEYNRPELGSEVYLKFKPDTSGTHTILLGDKINGSSDYTLIAGKENTLNWQDEGAIASQIVLPQEISLTIEPGTILKFAPSPDESDPFVDQSIGLKVLGNLSAKGTLDQPIIFTSLHDDKVGGDTNQDGNQTQGKPGDWQGIRLSGSSASATLENIEIHYANKALEGIESAKINLNNAILSDNNYGVYVYSPFVEVDGKNCLIARNKFTGVFVRADSREVFRNCTITGNGFAGSGWDEAGIHLGGANLTLENTIVAFNKNGLDHSANPDPPVLKVNHSLFYNPDGEEVIWWETSDDLNQLKLDENGNLNIDPLFVNADQGNYQLSPGSPAIDAGLGTNAPAQDLFGKSRYDDPGIANTGTGNPSYIDLGVYEAQAPTVAADLAVEVENPKPQLVSVGEEFTIYWTVKNQGGKTATGTWIDQVYLSNDPYPSSNDLLLATREHTTPLASGESYTETLTATVPSSAGLQYLVVASDRTHQIVKGNELNNIAAASQRLNVSAPLLKVGVPVTGTVTKNGWTFYRLDAETAENLRLKLDSKTTSGTLALYTQSGEIPTLMDYEQVAALTAQPDQQLRLNVSHPGTYYIGVYAQQLPTNATNFTLSAETTTFGLSAIDQKSVVNQGTVTLKLLGDDFSAKDSVYLLASDNVTQIQPLTVFNQDSSQTYATFNFAQVPVGIYDVVVKNAAGNIASLTDHLTVASAGSDPVSAGFYANMVVPGMARPGRRTHITLEYGNHGTTDITSPLLRLTSAADIEWQIPGTDEWITGASLDVLAINSDGVSHVLRPGDKETLTITARTPFREGEIPVTLSGFGIENQSLNAPIDWETLEISSRPPGINLQAWDVIWENLKAQTGDTWGDLLQVLGDNANYLQKLNQPVGDGGRLFAFEVLQAAGLNLEPILTASQDALEPAPGLPLSFMRFYENNLESRYEVGALGRGWTHNYAIALQPLENGTVLLHSGSVSEVFNRQSDGSYEDFTGGNRVLSKNANGTFSLDQPNGILYQFAADGRLTEIRDRNQNHISLSYTAGHLTNITHSSGQSLHLEYNHNGRLMGVSDRTGRQTTYEYDETGEHLIKAIAPDGTTTYTYSDSSNPAIAHALVSLTDPAGIQQLFSYDSQGRLISNALNNGAEKITYRYDSAGTITVKDATGATTQIFCDARGIPIKMVNPLGQSSQTQLNADGKITQINSPTGLKSKFTYDEFGNVTQVKDPLGMTTSFGYDTNLNHLSWVRDARQNTLKYRYDQAGNLLEITYPDASSENFQVDDQGKLIAAENRRGDSIQYTYNADGLPIRKEYADGSTVEFAYDNRSNLISATDQNGIIAMVYDASDRLTKITYPDNRFLQFTYDAAGRRTRLVDQDNFTVNYRYDSLGRLSGLSDRQGEMMVSYTYDAVGRLIREDKGNGTATTYEYDAASQLLHIVNFAPDNAINSRFDYTYDPQGQRTTMTTLAGTWHYGYDANGQLISVKLPDGNMIQYQYDAAGNRIAVTDAGVATAYTTNDLNQYTQVGNTNYDYDADGNLMSKTVGNQTSTYSYDAENRLINVTTPTGNWTYEYDALGNRSAVIQDGNRTEYLIDPLGLADVVGEYNAGGNAVSHYIHGLGLETRMDGNHTQAYYDFDALGSTAGISGNNGNYLNHYSYLPFGEDLTKVETVPNSFEYVGQWGVMDEGNHLNFMGNRYYSPELGRFTAIDPIGLLGGNTNLYSYVNNSPLAASDPEGLWSETFMKGGRAVGAWIDKTATNLSQKVVNSPAETYLSGYNRYQYSQAARGAGDLYNISQAENSSENRNLAMVRKFIDIGESIGSATLPFTPYSLPGVYGLASNPLTFFTHLLRWTVNLWEKSANAIKNIQIEDTDTSNIQTEEFDNVPSKTPEDKFGPLGYDPADTPTAEKQRFILPNQTFDYRIDFWNKPDAKVPTQDAVIVDKLDSDLDWRTFSFTNLGFLDWDVNLPGGQAVNTRVDLRPQMNLAVDVEATFNPETGEIRWWFHAVDPITGESPDDPMAGFLPPFNPETQYELGWVEFTVKPKQNLPTGTEITNQAFVQFDFLGAFNPAPKPNPWRNTIDADSPQSEVRSLPPTVTTEAFPVSWSGSDPGSGIHSYDVFVSEDGNPYNLWLDNTQATQAIYTGKDGHSYGFYTVATDHLGQIEFTPTQASASTRVSLMSGDDTLPPSDDTDTLPPSDRTQRFIGTNRSDLLSGSVKDDILLGLSGHDFVWANAGDDLANGNRGHDSLYGDLGDDSLYGGKDQDLIFGNRGNDVLWGNLGNDTLYGGKNDDTVFGNQDADVVRGDLGNDILYAGKEDDTVFGNRGNDTLHGDFGKDILYGGKNDDLLIGDRGNDGLWGNLGDDTLTGVDRDAVRPGVGEVDTLQGGQGSDRFVIGDAITPDYNDGNDTNTGTQDYVLIADFNISEDIIQLHGSAANYQIKPSVTGLPAGSAIFLKTANFEELIAICQNTTLSSLESSSFNFV